MDGPSAAVGAVDGDGELAEADKDDDEEEVEAEGKGAYCTIDSLANSGRFTRSATHCGRYEAGGQDSPRSDLSTNALAVSATVDEEAAEAAAALAVAAKLDMGWAPRRKDLLASAIVDDNVDVDEATDMSD